MKNFWWSLWIFNLVLGLLNSFGNFNNGNFAAGLAWSVATLWVVIILIQKYELDKYQNN